LCKIEALIGQSKSLSSDQPIKRFHAQANHWLRSAEKATCNCCKINESDWCMLLDPVKIKSIHQSGSRILQQLQSSFFC